MTPDTQAAEIEALIEKDREQLRRKIAIARGWMSLLLVAAMIGMFIVETLVPSSVSLRFWIIGLLALNWPLLHRRTHLAYRVTRAIFFPLSCIVVIAVSLGQWGLEQLGLQFSVMFLGMIVGETLSSWLPKSKEI